MYSFGYNVCSFNIRPSMPSVTPEFVGFMNLAQNPGMFMPPVFSPFCGLPLNGGYSYGYGNFMMPSCCTSRFIRTGIALNMVNNIFSSLNNDNNTTSNMTYPSTNYYMPNFYSPMSMNYISPFNFSMPMINTFRMPSFFALPDFSKIFENCKKITSTERVDNSSRINTKSNLPQLEDINYDEKKGSELASDALNHAHKNSIHQCAQYVKESIERVGLGKYKKGHAYACADILAQNPNFKEINASGRDFKNLPAGCVIVYPQGDCGYSKEYGHLEIATGKDNTAVSDFINTRIKPSDNARVFVPVSNLA